MAADKKSIDPVTVIGVIVAIAILIGGNMYNESQRSAWKKQQDAKVAEENRRHDEEEKARAAERKNDQHPAPPPDGKEPSPGPAVAPAPKTEEQPEPAPQELTIKGTQLTVVFNSKGATLQAATLNEEYVNPAKPVQKGLELLAEIEPGKRSLAIPRFEIGPADSDKEKDRFVFDRVSGPLKSLDSRVWKVASDSGSFDSQGLWKVSYQLDLPQKFTLTKTFTVHKDTYLVEMDLKVENRTDKALTYTYTMIGQAGILLDGPKEDPKLSPYGSNVRAVLAGRDASDSGDVDIVQVEGPAAPKVDEEKRSISKPDNVWVALKNRFFMALFVSRRPEQVIKYVAVPMNTDKANPDKRVAEPNLEVDALRRISPALEPAKVSDADSYALYLGPATDNLIEAAEAELKPPQPLGLRHSMLYCEYFGMRWPNVDKLARGMLWIFRGFSAIFGNFGVAVILLTITIKAAMHPLQRKMMISMSKMQKLQPEMAKIKEKYKGQTTLEAKARMNQETSDLMKRHGANSAGGCLPMFIQIPIFAALYGICNHAFEFRGATFLWIKDLSQQDHLADLPFWPGVLNLLPIIYVVTQLVQMRFQQPPPSDDPQQEMNRKMMQFMPLVMCFAFYKIPSGLVLYFAASAIFGMIESWYIKKYLIKDTPKATSGGSPGVTELATARGAKR